MLHIYITVDVEVWPARVVDWPHVPLQSEQACVDEVSAFLRGDCSQGNSGVLYQLEVLRRYGLKATFFVDPLFSYALGLGALRDVVYQIRSSGQSVGLHLHPEWLTDPRCSELPDFRGPIIGDYPEAVQEELIRVGIRRLVEAGAESPKAFRAGSWGAKRSTLRSVKRNGLVFDASLNASYPHSLPDLPNRMDMMEPFFVDGLVEVPITRFDDGFTVGKKPLSMVGVSGRELRHVVESSRVSGKAAVAVVMHGNEFLRTERLETSREPNRRRLVRHRFERFCRFVATQSDEYQTCFISDAKPRSTTEGEARGVVCSNRLRTAGRLIEQVISRWY